MEVIETEVFDLPTRHHPYSETFGNQSIEQLMLNPDSPNGRGALVPLGVYYKHIQEALLCGYELILIMKCP